MSKFYFKGFAALIAARFAVLSKYELFVLDMPGQDVWDAYLAAFPEGTNPIYRVRTDHDGSYDRSVVRKIGNVCAIINGKVETLWGNSTALPYPYNEVAAVLDAKLQARTIEGVYRTQEPTLGYANGTVEVLKGGATHRWYHFHAKTEARHLVPRGKVGEAVGEIATKIGVFERGLRELTLGAIDDVIGLIGEGNLYRGNEHLDNLTKFRAIKLGMLSFKDDAAGHLARNRWGWNTFITQPWSVTLIKNTVIGTLLEALSEGEDLERAVKAYEAKVAPTNYKRPKALVTQGMVNEAVKTIQTLGIERALERRFAVIGDLTPNNVLWVDNDVRSRMRDGVAGLLDAQVKRTAPTESKEKPTEISMEAFSTTVMPHINSMEVFLANPLQANLVSLTAPVDAYSARLFKWDNPFGWSYAGNITDSIKERVKAAGGNIKADLRVSLAWFNHDDLDLHCFTPHGEHLYFGNKQNILDVDMNAGHGSTRKPVENMAFMRPANGEYKFAVHNFAKRESDNVGFALELDVGGITQQFSYKKPVAGNQKVDALSVTLSGNDIVVKPHPDLEGGGVAIEKWGLTTETWHKVNTLLLSPNHWDDQQVGNKHWFFILEGCRNDEPTRGIFNEFLRTDLDKHRRVFEVLGNKTLIAPAEEQLSGVGFSSTKRDSVTVRVSGTNRGQRTYTIHF